MHIGPDAVPEIIENDIVVGISYTLTVDGELWDSVSEEEPFEFIQGHGNIVPGLEIALQGLKAGDRKVVTVTPEYGYGEYDEGH